MNAGKLTALAEGGCATPGLQNPTDPDIIPTPTVPAFAEKPGRFRGF